MRTLALILISLAVLMSGCELIGRRTVFVPQSQPVRLAQTVKAVEVWVIGADGKPYKTRKDLPEGHFVGPLIGEGR